jgi:hypothetical protein
MSLDEIRTQKALALLEFQEAEENVARLRKEKGDLALAFHGIATMIEQNSAIVEDKWEHVTVASACAAIRNVNEAKQQLAAALAKKQQFGL